MDLSETVEIKEKSLMPEREAFPMIINQDLGKFENLSQEEKKEFRRKEVEMLASQINDLPFVDFAEDREREMARLLTYYTEFTNLFGVDLIAVARTRMQGSGTVMKSSPLFMLSMIDDEQKSEQNAIFFESRLEAGGFKLNATSQNIIEGFSYRFSVLKRQLKDRYGEYEVDFPAVSLDRKPLTRLVMWHKENFDNLALEENIVLKNMEDLFALRVHDWFHSAVIYDTASTTNIFKKWSDNSFFVKHFFDNPFMINYELLADKTHFLIWQEMFRKDPKLRGEIIGKAKALLDGINELEKWCNNNDPSAEEETLRIGNYLAYVGLRGLFNVMSFEDTELKDAIGGYLRFRKVVDESLNPYKDYLRRIYEGIEDIPFRKGSDKSLSMEQIFQEYVDALTEESRLQIAKATTSTILKTDLSGVGIKKLLDTFPKYILKKMAILELDLADFDPRIFQIISANLGYIKSKYGEELFEECVKRIDIDSSGYFYLKVERGEVDENLGWGEAVHFKRCVLVQLPWDCPKELNLSVKRTENLLAEQVGASVKVRPGEIILINVRNNMLANSLIAEGQEDNNFSFELFWKALEREKERGHQDLGDIYPYNREKALKVFKIPIQKIKQSGDRFILEPGVYQTHESRRKVIRALGPISMDGSTEEDRRRILSGAIADNNIHSDNKIDRFPVDARSFDRSYSQVSRLDLSPFRFDEKKLTTLGMNEVVDTLLKSLESANSIKIYGYRGKPEKVKFELVLD